MVLDVGDDHSGAVLNEQCGGALAESAGAAGDYGDFAVQPAKGNEAEVYRYSIIALKEREGKFTFCKNRIRP